MTTDLATLSGRLTAKLADHPRTALALYAAWLDPVRYFDHDAIADLLSFGAWEPGSGVLIAAALGIARDCLPRTYPALAAAWRAEVDEARFHDLFEAALQADYPNIQLGYLDDLPYGVPLPFSGVDACHPEFSDQHPRLAHLLADAFDLTPKPHPYWPRIEYAIAEEDYERARHAAEVLIKSLSEQDRQPYADLALLLMHAFAISGNTLADYSAEEYWEAGFEPLEWHPDHLALVDEACAELNLILDGAAHALDHLDRDPALHATLTTNAAALLAAERTSDVPITWPADRRPDREAAPDAGLLFLRAARAA